ncbi:MAG: DsrE family protein [Methanobacteriota archaeon]|nr:MAG: DsrE family protein [Euryarchaeota archaeon]
MAKKIMYVQTSGPDSPERLYSPFVLATTARAMDIEATVYFLGKGILAMMKGEPQKVQVGSFPTLKEVMDQAVSSGVKIKICAQSAQLFGTKASPEEFEQPSEIVGAATLNDLALECDAVLTF